MNTRIGERMSPSGMNERFSHDSAPQNRPFNEGNMAGKRNSSLGHEEISENGH